MKSRIRFPILALAGVTCALLAGCLFKPTTVPTRSFVLAPAPAQAAPAAAGGLPFGVGLVKMPPYLMRSSLAVRKSGNEIEYLEGALWAERLDISFQRTLAANLCALLPSDQVRLTSWQRNEVAVAVYVGVEQFDVDEQGLAVLIAWWRVTSPGANSVLKNGRTRLTRNVATPRAQPEAMVTALSELTAELSQTLAQAIRTSAPPGVAAGR